MRVRLDTAVDQPLLTALRTGQHRRAATLIIGHYAPAVLRLCKLLDSPDGAEDLAHDCFVQAFASFGTFRASESPRAWLLGIAGDRCLARLDATCRAHRPTVPPDLSTASYRGDPAADAETVRAAFERLVEPERAVLGLHVAQLLPGDEAATRLGLEPVALQRLLVTTLAALAADVAVEPAEATERPGETPEACFPGLLTALQAMRWRPSSALARRLDVLAAAL